MSLLTVWPECSINRYYDPTTDGFMSFDPDVANTDQPYLFTNDDPLNAEDPLGQDPAMFFEGALTAETTDDWNPVRWFVTGVTLVAFGEYEGYKVAQRVFTKSTPTVRDILKGKKGSIKDAPLTPGSPSWNEIQKETQKEIDEEAAENRAGYKVIKKLLSDMRFNK
jgi:hypothetical protein